MAVKVTEPPLQKVVGPDAVTVLSGIGLTVTTSGSEIALVPFVTVTTYDPAVFTTIDFETAPVDHR